MDGNRRWAAQRQLTPIEGHKAGANALRSLVELAPRYGIKYLTVYAFSTENWRRSPKEIDFLFKLLGELAVKELNDLVANDVRVRFIGNLQVFKGERLYEALKNLEEKTRHNQGLTLNVALNYGSIDEILHALQTIKQSLSKEQIQDLSTEDFAQYLYYGASEPIPDPDIIVRTGGEKRLSNFLLWQSAFSKLLFIDTLWPDFNEEILSKQVLQDLCSRPILIKR